MFEETCHCRTILFRDFNCDQMLQEKVDAFQQLREYYNFVQGVKYYAHIHGGIWIWSLTKKGQRLFF